LPLLCVGYALIFPGLGLIPPFSANAERTRTLCGESVVCSPKATAPVVSLWLFRSLELSSTPFTGASFVGDSFGSSPAGARLLDPLQLSQIIYSQFFYFFVFLYFVFLYFEDGKEEKKR
jgi:hypothetical protein